MQICLYESNPILILKQMKTPSPQRCLGCRAAVGALRNFQANECCSAPYAGILSVCKLVVMVAFFFCVRNNFLS